MSNSEQTFFHLITASLGEATQRTPVFQRTKYTACTVEYILSGRGFLEEGGQRWELGSDDIYFLKKYEDHRYGHDRHDPWKKLFFVIDGPLMDLLFNEYLSPDEYVFHQCSGLKHYFTELLTLSDDRSRKAAILFHNLLYDLYKRKEEEKKRQKTPESELKKHLDAMTERPFFLQDYAAEKGFSKSYLIRRFRSAYGTTPYHYLLKNRMQKAEDMLRYTNLQIKEIAGRLAFPDPFTFSHSFQVHTGISPKAFRKKTASFHPPQAP